jgi:hypothetical protein
MMVDSAGITIVENHVPTWAPEEAWSVSEEPLFVIPASGSGNEDGLLDPTSIDVDGQGRIIIGDGNQAGWDAVLVFDSLDGEGPGEFGQLWWASSYRGDSIVAFDMADDKLAVFDPAGEFVREVRTPSIQTPQPEPGTYGFTAGADGAFDSGHFLAYPFGRLDISEGPGPAWYRHLLLKVAPDGESWDTLGTFVIQSEYWNGTNQEQYWFGPMPVKVLAGDGFWFGKGESFQVTRYDGEGRPLRIARRPYEVQPVSDGLKNHLREWYLDRVRSSPEVNDEILERIRQQFDDGQFAETVPPYSGMLVDSHGNVWVEQFRWFLPNERSPMAEPSFWSVFDSDGIWQGDVEVPSGLILRHITENRALGFVIDEFDVKEVHVHRLAKPGR